MVDDVHLHYSVLYLLILTIIKNYQITHLLPNLTVFNV